MGEPADSSPVELVPPPTAKPDRTAAFSAFYKQEMPSLVAFLMAMGSSLHDAKDAAQEAMRLAYSAWSTINSPRAWTRTVASREYFRRVLDCREEPADELPEMPDRDSVDEAVMVGQEQLRVLELLRELPLRQRQVMAWTLDRFRPKEIADLLEITPNDVRVNLHKARQALKARLAQEGGRTP